VSFAEFEQSIISVNLKQVARVWYEARNGRQMPAWTDISPAKLKTQLPMVWSYAYDAERDDFVGRLAGEAISGMSSGRFKGLWLSELRPPDKYPRALARARRIVKEPALYRGEGLVYKTADNFGYGERISLPISTNGSDSDGIFGATEYRSFSDWDTSSPAGRTEIEHWFSVA
jgi:hypothetical protein